VRHRDRILVIREPANNEWRPGCWGLPGGKRLPGESLRQCLARKLETDVRFPARVTGLHCIYDILMPDKSVVMFIYVAEAQADPIGTIEGAVTKWIGLSDLPKMNKDDFTEYYNDELLWELLAGEIEAGKPVLRTQDNRRPEIMEWMNRGRPSSGGPEPSRVPEPAAGAVTNGTSSPPAR
jgi:ADP-ribose pyrophosphatase YjhB (NUDIX family)